MLTQWGDTLYRLEVPFDGSFTAVFFIRLADGGWTIVDAAREAADVSGYILPAAAELGIRAADVRGILFTHTHGDHAGGLAALCAHYPHATAYRRMEGDGCVTLRGGESLFGGAVMAVDLCGHAPDMIGYLDTRRHTLVVGDGLQFYGVGHYGCQIYGGIENYYATIRRLRGMVTSGAVCRMLASHHYCPVGSVAEGRDACLRYLDSAQACMDDLLADITRQYRAGETDSAAIQSALIAARQGRYPDFPTDYFRNLIELVMVMITEKE